MVIVKIIADWKKSTILDEVGNYNTYTKKIK